MYQHILDKAKPVREPSANTTARNKDAAPLKARAHRAVRGCSWPGCEDAGEHRAPKSRDEMNLYHWFCLDHVRVYNKAWNYYAGLSEDEVEQEVRRDTTWCRPSWPLGPKKLINAIDGIEGWMKDFGLDGDSAARRARGQESKPPETPNPVQHALDFLDLDHTATMTDLKRCYKDLVKRHHPDANGGDKEAEERFKQINEAYRVVKEHLAS